MRLVFQESIKFIQHDRLQARRFESPSTLARSTHHQFGQSPRSSHDNIGFAFAQLFQITRKGGTPNRQHDRQPRTIQQFAGHGHNLTGQFATRCNHHGSDIAVVGGLIFVIIILDQLLNHGSQECQSFATTRVCPNHHVLSRQYFGTSLFLHRQGCLTFHILQVFQQNFIGDPQVLPTRRRCQHIVCRFIFSGIQVHLVVVAVGCLLRQETLTKVALGLFQCQEQGFSGFWIQHGFRRCDFTLGWFRFFCWFRVGCFIATFCRVLAKEKASARSWSLFGRFWLLFQPSLSACRLRANHKIQRPFLLFVAFIVFIVKFLAWWLWRHLVVVVAFALDPFLIFAHSLQRQVLLCGRSSEYRRS
mmetsp:Transcript_11371/g.23313  ORF Transcript_11371/g.23313 Transcript_11371/m.23313 type:complete len:360 (+) Transcript_11371:1093-2172(+)